MKEKYNFNGIEFDNISEKFTILNGTKGTYSYHDIKKCQILNEDTKFFKKTEPFAHQVLGGTTFVTTLGEPSLYVGIKIIMKNENLALYISGTKTFVNSDIYLKDRKEAESIKLIIDRIVSNNATSK